MTRGSEPDYLILVNKDNPLPAGYRETIDLVEVSGYDAEVFMVERRTAESFKKMQEAVKELGMEILLDSGYRSPNRQEEIRREFIAEYGEAYASKYVAAPGTSEHHTGLAVDFVAKIGGKWLIENDEIMKRKDELRPIYSILPDFCFILRYLPGKEKITGYPQEPWHIRYVGEREIAKEIMDRELTLEEYLKMHGSAPDAGKITYREI